MRHPQRGTAGLCLVWYGTTSAFCSSRASWQLADAVYVGSPAKKMQWHVGMYAHQESPHHLCTMLPCDITVMLQVAECAPGNPRSPGSILRSSASHRSPRGCLSDGPHPQLRPPDHLPNLHDCAVSQCGGERFQCSGKDCRVQQAG